MEALLRDDPSLPTSDGVREWVKRCRARKIKSVLEIHGPCESIELSKVQIGLETT